MEPIEAWASNLNLNPDSPTTQRLYKHRHISVYDYILRFRRGCNVRVIPHRVLSMTIEDVLQKVKTSRGRLEGVNIRKLLIDLRDKFEA